ncbi:ammonium permease [Polychytrium aggregatum]|uniref:ammonium permease n=1 Tax=Polychytrium aggregatum TaxID=110093 RepID=UPI0022FDCCED|nr:ammonium permease [Polychytrium aggregatum]KAI9193063.1 ammonium permease [Polychytrium aggregatum]
MPGPQMYNSTSTPVHFSFGRQVNIYDTIWLMICTGGVLLVSPACGMFYAGTAEYKNVISILLQSIIIFATITLQWWAYGYSLALSPRSTNPIIGDFVDAGFETLLLSDSSHIHAPSLPSLGYALYQGMFAAATASILYGAAVERVRILPLIVFILIWTTFVYDPVTYWVWAPNGWLIEIFDFLDFAGGAPVHIVSGFSGLALCLAVGPRKNPNLTPTSLPLMFTGTVLMWFGWLFFNGGSSFSVAPRALIAMLNTSLGAATGGLTWVLFDYRIHKKHTTLGFCSGVVAGLACITPASGYVFPHFAVLFGLIGSLCANMGCFIKSYFQYDDTMDTFPVHGISGAVGSLLTGIFASVRLVNQDPRNIPIHPPMSFLLGGAIDGNWMQVPKQLLGISACATWSFFMTFAIAKLMERIPALSLRVSPVVEAAGLDISLCGEAAYDFTHSAVKDSLNEFDLRTYVS